MSRNGPPARAATAADPRPAGPPAPADPHAADTAWRTLARLLAAPGRSRMRLWNDATGKFTDTAKRTDRLPTRPAAVYLYTRGRTTLLWLDFDAKGRTPGAVDADLAAAEAWITQCGGVVITDRSTSGGRHLICPLAVGTAASQSEMATLARLLAARLPTLDITPLTNAETGCMTPPGSPCREGGHRVLDGPLDAALDALTTRSAPDLLPRLYMLLGALKPTGTPHVADASRLAPVDLDAHTDGRGDQRRLAPVHQRTDPLPPEVATYAATGTRSPSRPTWRSHHEARMSVVTQAIARGYDLDALRAAIAPGGQWHAGLGRAYDRYQHRADLALRRDFDKALHWLIGNVVESSPPRHKTKDSPGGQLGHRGPRDLRVWLANALAWADREYVGKRYRWTVHAVLQTVALYALLAGERRAGTWLVGVGGRALSLSCGLLSEDTVWRVLADLRDTPGAPLVLARRHVGTDADVYALTTHNTVVTGTGPAERVRVEAVHPAWTVLGHHLRRLYELVAHHGLRARGDLYAAAAVSQAAGDNALLALEIAGLVTRSGRGSVAPGSATLDDVAARHHLGDVAAQRLATHRSERAQWRGWLADREQPAVIDDASTEHAGPPVPSWGVEDVDHAQWLRAVMATGPPESDDELAALELLANVLGARIVAV